MESRSQHQQLIDQNKGFHRDSIQKVSKSIGSVDRDYHTVAIIGVQNSGKSTLLNHLFGTKFQVLKQMSGTRTTRGIWVSSDQKQNILVFDVEGNDSMDRVESQDYQKMVATYALVTANVLLINTWSKTLGQHHGSQYETLKIILDICINQFKQQSPKTILFCLRDFNDQYQNQRQVQRKVVDDVANIWRKIQKPKQLQMYNDKPQKFFTVQVSVLRKYRPDKPEKFIQDVAKLRQKFVNPKSQGYVFAKQKTEFNLPIQDLPQLSEKSWHSIMDNKKLNLPNQKEQLANFRCSTILSQVENDFQKQLQSLTQGNLITDLGKLKQKYMQIFNKKTYHYGKNIADQKLHELASTIDDLLKKMTQQKLDTKTKQIIKQFEEESLNYSQQTQINLDQQIHRVYEVKVQELIEYMKNLNYQIVDRKQRIDELSKTLKESIQNLKKNMLKKNQDNFLNQSSRSSRLLTSELINNNFGMQFWQKARSSIDEKSNELVQNYRKSYKWVTGEELNPVQYGDMQQKIRNQSKQFIKSQLEKSFQSRVLQQFKNRFSKDQNGHTINFNLKTQEQISQHFDKTRQYIIDLIKKMNEYNETPRVSLIQDVGDQNSLFESTWLSNITQQIDKQMIGQFEKTMRRKKQGEMNEVPWWMFVLILFFVYDDIWFSEEDNPIIHYSLLVVLLLFATLFAIGQGKVIKQTVRIVVDKLKEKFAFLR